jgi:hypothetical protein
MNNKRKMKKKKRNLLVIAGGNVNWDALSRRQLAACQEEQSAAPWPGILTSRTLPQSEEMAFQGYLLWNCF